MATYYADPAATGADDGSSWTDAWPDVQTAFDTAVVGDTVYCRGTQTLTATVDVDTNDGGYNTGYIRFVGCNAAGANDGTRFVLDGNSAVASCLQSLAAGYYWIENFELKNATNDGYLSGFGTSAWWMWINCSFNNNGRRGAYLPSYGDFFAFVRCVFHSNVSDGFYSTTSTDIKMIFCRARDNGGNGFYVSSGNDRCCFIGCISDQNTSYGFYDKEASLLFNCVADGNGAGGLYKDNHSSILIGSRITNHSGVGAIGVNPDSTVIVTGWNYYENNDGSNLQNATVAYEVLQDGVSTDIEDQSDTDQGYTDLTDPEDYNLASDATLRRTAITIPES